MEYMAQNLDDLGEKYPFVKMLTDDVSGSGIDCDWEGKESEDFIRLVNSYHVLNEVGYYVGYADFTVLIPKKKPMDFKIQYRNAPSRNLANRNGLTEYLDDTIAYGMEMALERYPLKTAKKPAKKPASKSGKKPVRRVR